MPPDSFVTSDERARRIFRGLRKKCRGGERKTRSARLNIPDRQRLGGRTRIMIELKIQHQRY